MGCLRLTGWLFGIILRKRKFLFRALPQRLEGIAIRIGRRLETRIRHRGGRHPVLVMRLVVGRVLDSRLLANLIYPPFHHGHHRSGGVAGSYLTCKLPARTCWIFWRPGNSNTNSCIGSGKLGKREDGWRAAVALVAGCWLLGCEYNVDMRCSGGLAVETGASDLGVINYCQTQLTRC